MPTLEIRRLTKRYRRVPVVNEVSFSVKSGEITGYLGPNGSGKSTTVKMLAGLVEPSGGQILLDGIDVPSPPFGRGNRLDRAGLSHDCLPPEREHSYLLKV